MNNTHKKTLIYVSNWLGTSETFIYNQLGVFTEDDKPVISALNRKENKNIIKSDQFNVHFLPDSKMHFCSGIVKRKIQIPGNGYKAYPLQRKKIKEVICSENVGLIHAHYGTMGLNVLPVAQEFKIPLITTFHGNDASKMLQKKAYRKSLEYLFEYKNSHIIAVSNKIKERLIGLGAHEDKIRTHYIGTNISRFQFIDRADIRLKMLRQEKIIFLQVSNFVEKKGHTETIKAFKSISDKYPNVYLHLGGDGETKEKCVSLANDLGLKNRIKFLGRINPHNVYQLMENSDFFVHNSITGNDGSEEGIPTVIMEAMSTGLPVISTTHAGIPELVVDGVTGFLAEERNIKGYVDNFEKAIKCDSRKMGFAAFKHVKLNFNLADQNIKLKEIYKNVIGMSS